MEKNAKYHQMRMPERDKCHKLEGDGEMEIYSIKKKINDKDKKRKYPTTIQRLTTRFESNRAPLPNHILNTHALDCMYCTCDIENEKEIRIKSEK